MNFLLQDKARLARLSYAILAFLVAVISDLIFWNKAMGLGAFLVVVLYTVGFTVLAHYSNHAKNKWAMLLLIPIFILAFDQILYNNDLVKTAVPFFIFILVIVYSILLTIKNENKFVFYFKNIPVVKNVGVVFKHFSVIFRDLLSWTKGTEHNEKYKQIAIGLAVSLPIIFVFTMLFAGADKVFGDGLEKLVSFRMDLYLSVLWRVLRVVVYGFLVGAFFYTLIHDEHAITDKTSKVAKISTTVSAIVLTLVNILFAIFVFIQIKYLFGSHDFVISQKIVFAEYARSGFFQLAWVMVLSALLIMVFYRSSWHHGKNIFVSILKLLLIAQIFAIAVSVLKRMNLYQNEYGYTTLRLYVEWFIYFTSIIFAMLAVAIVKHFSFRKVFYTGLVCGVVAFTVVASINVDRIIARKNIQRFLTQNEILDLSYLMHILSIDAIPEFSLITNESLNSKFVVGRGQVNFFNGSEIDSSTNWFKNEMAKKKYELIEERTPWYTFNFGVRKVIRFLYNYH